MRSNELDFLINWGDTDMAGIVYYPNYFKWFDIAGHQFFRSCELAPLSLEKERGIILPMIDVRCTFEKPLYYDDIITIHTTVQEIKDKTIQLSHEVLREGERTGYGYELRGWVEKREKTIKAVSIPSDIRKILEEDVHIKSQTVKPQYNA